MAEDSKEMKVLRQIFEAAQGAEKDAARARKVCDDTPDNMVLSMAAAVFSHVQNSLRISSAAIKGQIVQQQRIEELERRLDEMEKPRIVKLSKTPPRQPPKP